MWGGGSAEGVFAVAAPTSVYPRHLVASSQEPSSPRLGSLAKVKPSWPLVQRVVGGCDIGVIYPICSLPAPPAPAVCLRSARSVQRCAGPAGNSADNAIS